MKRIRNFFIISIIIILFLPIINFFNKKDESNLYNIDRLESIFNSLLYRYFGYSFEPDNVIIGKDKFMFLGNKHSNIIDKYIGVYTNPFINTWVNDLKKLQHFYKNKNIKFLFVIVPNKSTLYYNKLPDGIMQLHNRFTINILNSMQNKNIKFIDLTLMLDSYKDKNNLFYKTDSHWNSFGAKLGYNFVLTFINRIYKTDINLFTNYQIIKGEYVNKDLCRLLKIPLLEQETIIKSIKKYYINYGHIDLNKLKLFLIGKVYNNKTFSISGNISEYTYNPYALNNKKLLLIGDSFLHQISPLYINTFKYVYKIHYDHLNGIKLGDFIDKIKPDIVIYQVIERHLMNPNIVKRIPLYPDRIELCKGNLYNFDKVYNIKNNFYKYKVKNIKLYNDVLISKTNDPHVILYNLKVKNDSVLKCKIMSPVETNMQIFYKFNKDETFGNYVFSLPIHKGINVLNIYIPKLFINNTLRLDLVNKKANYKLLELKLYEGVRMD